MSGPSSDLETSDTSVVDSLNASDALEPVTSKQIPPALQAQASHDIAPRGALATAKHSAEAAFYRLPEELLTAIVHQLINNENLEDWELRSAVPHLKKLRLVHRRFTSLRQLNSLLFETIQFVVENRNYNRARQMNFVWIAPYMKQLKLYQPPLQDRSMTDLRRDLSLLRDGTFSEIFEPIVEALENCHRLSLHQSEELSQFDVVQRFTETRITSDIGDALLAAIVVLLTNTNANVHELAIHSAAGSFDWANLPRWDALNLCHLKKLVFSPHVYFSDRPFTGADGPASAVELILKKCAQSLESLKWGDTVVMNWPYHDTIPLPKLKHLTLHSRWLRACNFQAWMAQLPSLESLCLIETEINGDTNMAWRHVYDSIRDHPNTLEVEFESIRINFESSCSLKVNTGDVGKYEEMPYDARDLWMEGSQRSIALYLAGKIEWNEALDYMFQFSD